MASGGCYYILNGQRVTEAEYIAQLTQPARTRKKKAPKTEPEPESTTTSGQPDSTTTNSSED